MVLQYKKRLIGRACCRIGVDSRGDCLHLAIGVFVGVLLATLFFANKIGRFMLVKSKTGPTMDDQQRIAALLKPFAI
mgnify:CR=1 FL=1